MGFRTVYRVVRKTSSGINIQKWDDIYGVGDDLIDNLKGARIKFDYAITNLRNRNAIKEFTVELQERHWPLGRWRIVERIRRKVK